MSVDINSSWQNLASLSNDQIMKMSERELRAVVTKLNSVANKRLKRLEENAQEIVDYSRAYDSVMNSGGRFSVKNKNLNELRAEYKRVSSFLNSKTSSSRGTKKMIKSTILTLKEKGVDVTVEELGSIWDVYKKLKEMDSIISFFPSEQVVEAIKNSSGNTYKEILEDVLEELKGKYEEQEQNYNDFYNNEVSDGRNANRYSDANSIGNIYEDEIPF